MSLRLFRRIAVVALIAVVAGCNDADRVLPTSPLRPDAPARLDNVALTDTISKMIETLYPQNEQNPISVRWRNVQRKLEQGQDAVAQSQFSTLAQWLQDKTPNMLTPPLGETRTHATGRLVLYMSLIVYRVPTSQQPTVSAGGDMAYAIAQPSATTQVVVPSTNAALQLDAGSVVGPTVIVISQITSPWYPTNCSGPLDTKYCQYPSFYRYDEFPHSGLLKPGHFQMCHVQPGTFRGFLDGQVHGPIDERLVLAHEAPSDPSLRIPGGKVLGNIEVLPTSTHPAPRMVPDGCNGVTYPTSANGFTFYATPPSTGLWNHAVRALAAVTNTIGRAISPKNAYGFDQGIEHLALDFSPFGGADTTGRPDVGIVGLAASGGFAQDTMIHAHPGDVLTLVYHVSNISIMNQGAAAAAAPASATTAMLATDPGLRAPAAPPSTSPVAPLAPDASVSVTTTITIPANASGLYYAGATVTPGHAAGDLSDAGVAPKLAAQRVLVTPSSLFASWRAEPSLGTPRQAIATTMAGSTIFALGGWDAGGNGQYVVEKLDLSSPSPAWQASAPLPYPLGLGIAQSYPATNPTTLYFFGGAQSINAYNKTTFAFDLTQQALGWVRLTDAPSAPSLDYWVRCGSATIFGGNIYFTSSCDNSGGSARGFNPATGSYVTLTQSNDGYQQEPAGTVAWHNRMYVIGGANLGGAVNYYDMAGDAWHVGPSMPVNRWQGTAQVVNDCIYVFGGVDYVSGYYNANPVSTPTRDIYQMCPADATPAWRVVGQLPMNVTNAASVVVGGRVYLIGGVNSSGVAMDQVISATP